MKNIVVIGGGTMGNGIAHTVAAGGFDVTLVEVTDELAKRALSTITANLQRGVDKGKMTADERDAVADLVVEAIIENLSAKTTLFANLDSITHPECILASNTSSISITKIAAAT